MELKFYRSHFRFLTILLAFLSFYSSNMVLSWAAISANPPLANKQLIEQLRGKAQGFFSNLRFAQQAFNGSDLRFLDEQDNLHSLAEFRGKTILLALWASWCAPCREELPQLDRLRAKLPAKDFMVIAINTANKKEAAQKFLAKLGLNLDFYLDQNFAILDELRRRGLALGLPVALLFDKNLDLIASYNGIAPWADADSVQFLSQVIKAQEK